jgi:hypothetical protein
VIKTARQIAHQTLAKIAEGDFVSALNRGADTLGFGPNSDWVDNMGVAMGGGIGKAPEATQTLKATLPAARGVLSEVPGVLQGYKSKLQGLFSRAPEPTQVAEGGPKSFAEIKDRRKFLQAADDAAEAAKKKAPAANAAISAMDATGVLPNRQPRTAPAAPKPQQSFDYSSDPTQPIFNPSNVPKAQSLLQHETRQAVKSPQDRTFVNPIRHFQDKEEAILNKATYDPPRGNAPDGASTTAVNKAVPLAMTAATGAGVGAGLSSMSRVEPSRAMTGTSMSVAPTNNYTPGAIAPTTPAVPTVPNNQTTPTSRADRGLLRSRAQVGSPDTTPTYNDRASRGMTFRGPINR